MSIHWSSKGLAEQRLMEALVHQALARTRDVLRRQVVTTLLQRIAMLSALMLVIAMPAWPQKPHFMNHPAHYPPVQEWPEVIPEPRTCFTPGDQCTDMIVRTVTEAQHSILVQAYSFTSVPIATALRDAHRRGVQVQIILDKSQRSEKYSSADFLANQGVSVMIDPKHAIAHNKVVVIDGDTIITGSFNFTKAAQERNAENLLIIRDATLATQYAQNWEKHRQHSQPYTRGR